MIEIPLFPLSSVLFPYGQIPLQIFEQRYLDLIKDCMRNETGFGVVLILEGGESGEVNSVKLRLSNIGTFARIIDWDQLPNGLLGVTIKGDERFSLEDSWNQQNGLVLGNVNILQAKTSEPMRKEWLSLLDVLRRIKRHPHVERMHLNIDEEDAWQVGFLLAQLLPLGEIEKNKLLCLENIQSFMSQLDGILREISGESNS